MDDMRLFQTEQKEIFKKILASGAVDDEQREALISLGLEPSIIGAMSLAAVKKAAKGDLAALRYIRDAVAETPAEEDFIGKLADRPFDTIDLSLLTDEQLRALAARKKYDDTDARN